MTQLGTKQLGTSQLGEGGGQTLGVSVEELSAGEPGISVDVTIGVTVETLTATEPGLRVGVASPQTISVSTAALQASEPALRLLTDTGLIGGGTITTPTRTPDLIDVEATHDTISYTWRTRIYSNELSSIRAFRMHAGEVARVTDSDGGWEAFDDALDADNTFSVSPPGALVPPLQADTLLVQDYREDTVSEDGRIIDIEVRFVRDAPRDASGSTLSETQGTGEWLFEFSNGTIATPYVERSDQGGHGDVELELVVDDDQAEVVLESATYLEAVSVEDIPDGDDFVRDNNADDRNTVTITQPTSIDSDYLPNSGSNFVVRDWRVSPHETPGRWAVEMTVRAL